MINALPEREGSFISHARGCKTNCSIAASSIVLPKVSSVKDKNINTDLQSKDHWTDTKNTHHRHQRPKLTHFLLASISRSEDLMPNTFSILELKWLFRQVNSKHCFW